ncbi:unnamed protein product, partial [Didymodactylos carnosus]
VLVAAACRGRGFVAAIAICLGEHSRNVVINFLRTQKAAVTVAEQCGTHNVTAIIVEANVTKHKEIMKLFETTKKELEFADIMSNSSIEHWSKLDEVDGEQIGMVLSDYNLQTTRFLEKMFKDIKVSSVCD